MSRMGSGRKAPSKLSPCLFPISQGEWLSLLCIQVLSCLVVLLLSTTGLVFLWFVLPQDSA